MSAATILTATSGSALAAGAIVAGGLRARLRGRSAPPAYEFEPTLEERVAEPWPADPVPELLEQWRQTQLEAADA
jgi:hypothetical protein